MREFRGAPEPSLAELLAMLARVDIVMIEGFKREAHAKVEVRRASVGKPWLHPGDAGILGVIGDEPAPSSRLPFAHIDDVAGVADLVLACAEPIETALERLRRGMAAPPGNEG